MLTEFRQKAQVMPVVVNPKKYLSELKIDIDDVKTKLPPASSPFSIAWRLCSKNWRRIDDL